MSSVEQETGEQELVAQAREKFKAILAKRLADQPDAVAKFAAAFTDQPESRDQWVDWVARTGAMASEPNGQAKPEADQANSDELTDQLIQEIYDEIVAPRVQGAITRMLDRASELAKQLDTTEEDIIEAIGELDLDVLVNAATDALFAVLAETDEPESEQ